MTAYRNIFEKFITNKKDNIDKPSDSYHAILLQLLNDVSVIRDEVIKNGDNRLVELSKYYTAGVLTKSAINLAHYLALRQIDLQHLQSRLSQAGLSSFGRAEASVFVNVRYGY